MSSGAVYSAVTGVVGGGRVFPDYSMEEAPRDDTFVILRWGDQRVSPAVRRGPHTLTVWAHQAVEIGSDYTDVVKTLRDIQGALESMDDTPGDDGVRVLDVAFQGDSGNLYDPGFKTITRSSTYRVLLA